MHFAENCLKFIKLISSAWIWKQFKFNCWAVQRFVASEFNLIWPNPLTVFQRRFQRFVHNHGYASSAPLRTFSCRFLDRGCFARQGWYFSSAPLQILLATQSCLVNKAEELNGIEFFRTRGPHVDILWALCNSRCSKSLNPTFLQALHSVSNFPLSFFRFLEIIFYFS
jgi:hypothetical protein